MAGFSFKKSLITKDSPTLLYNIVNNSEVITVGDALSIDTNGHVILATAADEILGIAVGEVDKNGKSITPDSGSLSTYTMPSDNETDELYQVAFIADKYSMFSGEVATALSQTHLFQFFDLTDEDTVNISSAADTNGQFQLVGLDPDGDGTTTKGLFRIAESVLDPYTQD